MHNWSVCHTGTKAKQKLGKCKRDNVNVPIQIVGVFFLQFRYYVHLSYILLVIIRTHGICVSLKAVVSASIRQLRYISFKTHHIYFHEST